MIFSDSHISIAVLEDTYAITQLLNSAYRGNISKKGWTTEADLIAGEIRTNVGEIEQLILQTESVFLKYVLDNEIIGCVNLQKHDNKIYLGMLSVKPDIQGGGIGKKLLQAADEYVQQNNCASVYMTVIDVRHELIDWYKRHGFEDTGKRKSFVEDGISGRHLQPLQFAYLEKTVSL